MEAMQEPSTPRPHAAADLPSSCPRRRPSKSAFGLLVPGLVLVSGLGLVACRPSEPTKLLEPTRGTILISIDTLRADFLGTYGHDAAEAGAETSPFLDSLAARGAVFEHAYAHLPGTLPSHMSMFTGLYPGEHGVYPPEGVLPPELPSLPEVFTEAGYRAGGFSEGGYVSGSYGFERGFEVWDDANSGKEEEIETTLSEGLDFVKSLEPSDRFFLFLHSYSVHDPYHPAPEYLERFWQGERPADYFDPTGPNLVQVNKHKRSMSPELLAYFRACYKASIAYMDDVLKNFFAELETLGLLDEVTVVITSDHGEAFLEHGTVVHSSVYTEDLHVPLVVLHPQLEGGLRIPDVVETVDIPATLYDLAGLDVPGLSGQSFRNLLEGTAERPSAPQAGAEAGAGADEWQYIAFGESFVTADETLVAEVDGRLLQLVLARPKFGPEQHYYWVQKELSFDRAPGPFELDLRAFHEPREITISIDGEVHSVLEMQADAPQKVEIQVPDDRPWGRVRISGETCAIPADVSESKDERCLTFGFFRPPSLVRFELYDLDVDPLAQNDLSREESSLMRRMLARLQEIEHQARAEGQSQPLDPELEERLRSLGYIQ